VGNWVEIPAYECCNDTTTTVPLAFRLLFDDIANANLLVGDASSVEDWNTFFDLPTNGSPFTSVVIVGNEVQLIGGSGITLNNGFTNDLSIISVIDEIGCIISTVSQCFESCNSLTTIDLPALLIADDYSFGSCEALTSINLPLLTTAGGSCFEYCTSLTSISLPSLLVATTVGFLEGCTSLTSINLPSCTNLGDSVGDNNVFLSITGNTITLIVPSALMTCNTGNPDGDIQYLQANNTVTVITV
jgi:hypothetical protein